MKSGSYSLFPRCFLVTGLILFTHLVIPVRAETLNVAVASNFASTLEQVRGPFEADTGHVLNLITGASGSHYAQIINGAPFDLFLSADAARPAALQREGLITPAQRRVYALGRLALWSRDKGAVADLQALANLDANQRLAIANPRLAPYGVAAEQTLAYFGLHEKLKKQIVMGENVGQTFQFAYSGSAVLGIVAYAQVLALPGEGSHVLIPDAAYDPIVQEMVLLTSSPGSRALFDYLSSSAVTVVLEQAGYYSPLQTHGRP